jgi:hypothetical protein
MSVEDLELKNYINDPAVDIRTVKAGQRYFMINDVTDPDSELCGIVVTKTSGKEYASGDALTVDYEVTGKTIDLFPGGDAAQKNAEPNANRITDPNTESSTHQKLYNIKQIPPSAGGKRKPRRSQKNKSKSKPKSKTGGSRKSKKGGRR